MKPRLFIGSSTESLQIAYAVQQNLYRNTEITVWTQDIFQMTSTSLESLLEVLDKFDFGAFVFSPDDLVKIRGDEHRGVRDNVLFELGLFIGRLGRKRCFIMIPDSSDGLHIPTDLIGITLGVFESNRSDENWQAATGPVCNSIRGIIEKIGPQEEYTGSPSLAPVKVDNEETERIEKESKSSNVKDININEYEWLNLFIRRQYQAAYDHLKKRMSEQKDFTKLIYDECWLAGIQYHLDLLII